MKLGRLKFAITILLGGALAGTMAVSSAQAQRGRFRVILQQRRLPGAVPRQVPRQTEKMVPNGAVKPVQPNLRGMAGLPPKWIENMRNMAPEEQERFMQNDARFSSLPPQRRQQIRNNLQKWNNLTPQQQAEVRQREAALERMTPDQRQYFLNVVGPKYQALAQDRKQLVNRHLNMLGHMSADTQQAALNDSKFMQDLTPDEQDLVRNLNSLRNPAPAQ